jgi:hypothetical protein
MRTNSHPEGKQVEGLGAVNVTGFITEKTITTTDLRGQNNTGFTLKKIPKKSLKSNREVEIIINRRRRKETKSAARITKKMTETKICGKCHIEKDVNKFPSRGKAGRRAWCRECYYIYNRKYDHEHRSTRTAQHKVHVENNQERVAETHKKSRDKHKPDIKVRNRNFSLKQLNMVPGDYDRMFKEQNGVCAICGKPETAVNTKTGNIQRLSIDHDHKTGKIRGLLCSQHNLGIGNFDDDENLLIAAAAYVRKHKNTDAVSISLPEAVD